MFGDKKGERVKQKGLKQPENICFVSRKNTTKQIFLCSWGGFWFTCSPHLHRAVGISKNQAAESLKPAPGLLGLPIFSEYMNVFEGYRSLIEIFALSVCGRAAQA
jgi:hypothetical protein